MAEYRHFQRGVLPKEVRKAFGARLKALATEADLTQTAIADAFGIYQSQVWDWYEGTRVPPSVTVLDLEEMLRAEPGDLAGLLGFGPPLPDLPRAELRAAIGTDTGLDESQRRILFDLLDSWDH